MRAAAKIVARADGGGGTRLVTLRSEAPLVLRATAGAVYLVGGAGGPLAGDELSLEIDVGPGARLTVRSAAASVALPGIDPSPPSHVRIRATVGTGAELQWEPEPVVAVQGCDHRMHAAIDVGAGARLLWREELVLGRHQEPAGSVASCVHVDVDGRPLLRHELAVGPAYPASRGPAVAGAARAVGSVLLVDPAWMEGDAPRAAVLGPQAALFALDGPGAQIVALAPDALALRHVLDEGVHALTAFAG